MASIDNSFKLGLDLDKKLEDIVLYVGTRNFLSKVWGSLKFLNVNGEILTDKRIRSFIKKNSNLGVLLKIKEIALAQLTSKEELISKKERTKFKQIQYLNDFIDKRFALIISTEIPDVKGMEVTQLYDSLQWIETEITKKWTERAESSSPRHKNKADKKIADLQQMKEEILQGNLKTLSDVIYLKEEVNNHSEVDLPILNHASKAFQKIKKIFYEIQESNKKKNSSPTVSSTERIKKIFKQMILNGDVVQAKLLFTHFLKLKGESKDLTSKFRNKLFLAMQSALGITKYFLAPHNILSLEAVSFIINHLKEKNRSLNNLSLKTCRNFNQLKTKIKEFQSDKKGPKRCFFIINQYGGHLTPLYLEKDQKGQFHAVITDSKGLRIFETEKVLKKCLKNLSIYTGITPRQNDITNCPIFCIRDFIKFARHSEEMMQWILKPEKSNLQLSGNSYEFSYLPPQLMLVTQSLNDIIYYEQKNGPIELKMKHIRLKKFIRNKFQNTKIEKLYKKYKMLIIQKALEALV